MDIYLLQIIGNWLSVFFVSLVSFFGIDLYKNDVEITEKNSNVRAVTVLSEMVPYSTEYVYNNEKISKGEAKILAPGVQGINYIYSDGTVKTLIAPTNEIREIANGTDSIYTGRMTGYGPDCDTCDGRGITYCKTEAGKSYNIKNNGVYYEDDEYGKVRIVAAPISEFPCGTIVYVDNGRLAPFYAIVMDTGYSMKNGYDTGVIWFDLAYQTEKDNSIYRATSYNTTYKVQRWGW